MSEGVCVTLCLDALKHQLGGIGRYTWELARRLPQAPGVDRLRFYVDNRLIDDPGRLIRGEPIYRGRGIRRAVRALGARVALRSTVVHAPNYFLPQGARRGVVTVHDLSVFRYPETHPVERVRQFHRHFHESIGRAARIITDTETVRSELIAQFGVDARRVQAVGLGVSDVFRPHDPHWLAAGLRKWGLQPGSYGLCVSAVEPRKKIAELLNAWKRLPHSLRKRFPLVVAGGEGWENAGIHERLISGSQEGWLMHLGHVEETDLAQLYAGAALFVYPSIYEGFGLPPLEAMASGVPVIVSDRSCLPEVCGDAALYINPDDDNNFLSTIMDGLENERWRTETVTKGLKRASSFTWKRCVEDTVTIYKDVADHSSD